MKDLGPASVMFGIEIKRDRENRELFTCQSEYARAILDLFGMSDSKHKSTPMDRSYLDSLNQESTPAVDVPYRQAIGSLMYLMIGSRPDLAFAIGKLSQHAESPTTFNWIAAKLVLRYLNGTRDYGILYDGKKPLVPQGFSGADWEGCKISLKSTSVLCS